MPKSKELTSRDAKQLALIAPHVSHNGLALPKDTTYETWESIGKSIRLAGRSVMWWLGDWLVFGDDHFKDKLSQAADVTGYDAGTLSNVMSVCRNVPHKNRCGLSFEHHKEVAGLAPAQQEKFLDKAGRNHWTRAELREAIADAGLRKKPKVKAAKRKTKKEKAKEQTQPTTELYKDLEREMKAAAQLIPPVVEMMTSIADKWDERMPSGKELAMFEKILDEMVAGAREILLTIAQLQGIEEKAAA